MARQKTFTRESVFGMLFTCGKIVGRSTSFGTEQMPIRESDLSRPLRTFLEANGYSVRSEVMSCDMVATKDDEIVVIELKRSLTLQLLAQAAQRQRITDSVYVAVPAPKKSIHVREWRKLTHLLRRLELGLILVDIGATRSQVEIIFHPAPFERKKQKARRRAIIREIAGRTGDYNEAGSTRRKLVTAYREQAIHVACCLERLGPTSPKEIRALGACPKTLSILRGNFYGWFERVAHGTYALTAQGQTALVEYAHIAEHYRRAVEAVSAGDSRSQ